jgi:hypothetical protein
LVQYEHVVNFSLKKVANCYFLNVWKFDLKISKIANMTRILFSLFSIETNVWDFHCRKETTTPQPVPARARHRTRQRLSTQTNIGPRQFPLKLIVNPPRKNLIRAPLSPTFIFHFKLLNISIWNCLSIA